MVNAAIVGLGRWGRLLVDAVQGKSEKIGFVAGTTRSLDRAASFAGQHGIALRADYRAILDDPAVDAVVLATPPSAHAEQVGQAARAGKHVFVEKPFTLDGDSAAQAAAACIEAQRVLAVGFNRRFRPAVREVQRMATAGEFGTLLHLEGQWSGSTPGWRAPDSWRHSYEESPAGGMTPKGIHVLDTMMSLAGLVESVYAQSDRRLNTHTDDVTSMLLRFSGGATGYLATCLSTPDDWRLQIFGSQAWAEIRDERVLTVRKLTEAAQTRTFEPLDIERAELEAFADAVTGAAPYPVTIEQAICGSAALAAIVESALTRAAVCVSVYDLSTAHSAVAKPDLERKRPSLRQA